MSKLTIWKTKREAGENSSFYYSLKKEGFFTLVLTDIQFVMIFPKIDLDSVPQAPETATIEINGTLISKEMQDGYVTSTT